MKFHDVKILPEFFRAVKENKKRFECRLDDRGYAVGDVVSLREWSQESGYTGEVIAVLINYIQPGGQYGIADGWVVFGFE